MSTSQDASTQPFSLQKDPKGIFCWIRWEESLEGVCHNHPEGGCTKCPLLFLGVWSCRNQCMLRDKWFKIMLFCSPPLWEMKRISRLPTIVWIIVILDVYYLSGPHRCHVLGHPKRGLENNPVEIPCQGTGHLKPWDQHYKPFKMPNYSFPRTLKHTPRAHPRQLPKPIMKGIPLWPVGKGLGVCSKGVETTLDNWATTTSYKKWHAMV